MDETQVPEFVLVVKYEVNREQGESYAERPLAIAQSWQDLLDRFGPGRVSLLYAGVATGMAWDEMQGNESLMKPAWEEVSRRKFELEKQGVVENRQRPSSPIQSEFVAWA